VCDVWAEGVIGATKQFDQPDECKFLRKLITLPMERRDAVCKFIHGDDVQPGQAVASVNVRTSRFVSSPFRCFYAVTSEGSISGNL
jgi:hypothetical protein